MTEQQQKKSADLLDRIALGLKIEIESRSLKADKRALRDARDRGIVSEADCQRYNEQFQLRSAIIDARRQKLSYMRAEASLYENQN